MRRFLLLAASCAILTACGQSNPPAQLSSSADPRPSAHAALPCEPAPAINPTPSGSADLETKPAVEISDGPPPCNLVIGDIVRGSGPTAEAGKKLTVKYVGVTYVDGNEFDASWGKDDFTFLLGGGEVIAGWDQGFVGMQVGGRRQLVIPAELGYGTRGAGPIPPNATLVFVVDLVAIA